MQAYLAEFVGTAILILFGNGVVANVVLSKTKGQGGGWIVITAGWAFGVAMAVYAVGRVSGAHINPAVTIALASTGTVVSSPRRERRTRINLALNQELIKSSL